MRTLRNPKSLMKHLKIGIVEDDLLIAESIASTLKQIGYHPTKPVRSYDDALKMIETETPDLLIIDITLVGEKDGVDLALKSNKDFGIPFIFLTAYSDAATVNRAKKANPYAYLVKPFTENDLFTSVEIAFNNFNNQGKFPNQKKHEALKDILFIKEKELFYKVNVNDILYVESENVYLNIFTAKKNFLSRTKLDDFINDFTDGQFMRVHRSYAINLKHLEAVNSLTVTVAGKEIPVHSTYRQELLQKIKSLS